MLLQTARTWLRAIASGDAVAVLAYRKDKQANQFQGWIPEHLAELEAFIGRNPDKFNEPNTWYQLVILLSETDTIVGDVGIHFIDDKQVELGITLAAAYHWQGYATEVLQAVIHHLFSQLNKHRVTLSIDPRNESMVALAERLGFRKEAHHMQSYWLRGEWTDDVVYALLQTEWPTGSV